MECRRRGLRARGPQVECRRRGLRARGPQNEIGNGHRDGHPSDVERDDHRTGGDVLHDVVHACIAHRVQPEPAKGVQGELAHVGRDVRSAGDEEHVAVRGRRGHRPGAGVQNDGVADVLAEPVAVHTYTVGRLLERSYPDAGAVLAAAHIRRAGPERGPTFVRLLFLSATDGRGRHSRDHTTGPDRRPDHDDHDRL